MRSFTSEIITYYREREAKQEEDKKNELLAKLKQHRLEQEAKQEEDKKNQLLENEYRQ